MWQDKKKFTVNFAFNGLLGIVAFGTIQYAFFWVIDSTQHHGYWFTYHNITPLQQEFYIEKDDIIFSSDSTVKRSVQTRWNDILKCRPVGSNQESVFVSNYESSGKLRKGQRESKDWIYQAALPKHPSTCYLDSFTCAQAPFGFDVCQNIKSGEFTIK